MRGLAHYMFVQHLLRSLDRLQLFRAVATGAQLPLTQLDALRTLPSVIRRQLTRRKGSLQFALGPKLIGDSTYA